MALSTEPGAQPIITAADNNIQRRVKHSLLFRLFSAHKLLWSQKTTPCPPTAAPWHFRRMNESRSPQPTLEYALFSPPEAGLSLQGAPLPTARSVPGLPPGPPASGLPALRDTVLTAARVGLRASQPCWVPSVRPFCPHHLSASHETLHDQAPPRPFSFTGRNAPRMPATAQLLAFPNVLGSLVAPCRFSC